MQFFIDTANPQEIKTALEWGIVDGVTTNPSLAASAGIEFKKAVKQILEMVDGPVSLEVISTDSKGMLGEARKLTKLGKQVVVKLPTTAEGLKALKILSAEGVKTNMTLVFSAMQALLVGKLGATYVSPFIGRLDDIAPDSGIQLIEDIATIYDNYGFTTNILSASIRSIDHVRLSALAGADVATVPFKILEKLVSHKLTDQGLQAFLTDWKNSGLKQIV